jgi:hypothetical protein
MKQELVDRAYRISSERSVRTLRHTVLSEAELGAVGGLRMGIQSDNTCTINAKQNKIKRTD